MFSPQSVGHDTTKVIAVQQFIL